MKHEYVLKKNLIFIFIMAASGLSFGFYTGSKSIITDGVVSSVIFLSSYAGIVIHSNLAPNNHKLYPYGKWRFEYIYNLLRLVSLLAIISYSFMDSIYVIYHYFTSGATHTEVSLLDIAPYFTIKIIAVIFSISWLKKNYNFGNINNEVYAMELSSVKVDGMLTIAILVGMVVFSQIEAIAKIADALTLLIVAIILGISIFSELQHLIVMMIGKRVYQSEEQFIADLIQIKYEQLHVGDIYLEKHGMISMIYIQCSFDTSMTTCELAKMQREIKSYLKIHKIEKPRLHFFFDEAI